MHGSFFTPINDSPNIPRRDTHKPTMAVAKNITQLLVLSCLLLFPSVLLSQEISDIIKVINSRGPYYGLISSSSSVRDALISSNEFMPDPGYPYVVLSGRTFLVGVIQWKRVIYKRVIYVSCGSGLVNAAAITQQLLDVFNITGIVHFGISGNTNSSLNIGDVVIPRTFVNTGLWDWLNPEDTISSSDIAELDIKDFNVPREGSNSLGRIGYSPEEVYFKEGEANVPYYRAWFDVYWRWFGDAGSLEGLELAQCVNATLCLKNKPKIVLGLNGSTSNIYVGNAAYRDFLFQTFGVSSADMESAAVIMTSISNGYPVIVVRGLANLAGAEEEGEDYSLFKRLVARNVVDAVLNLVGVLGTLRVPKSLIRMYE